MTIDDAKAHKALLERTLTEALATFNTETGLQVTDVFVLSTQGIGSPPSYSVSVQVILPSY
jgi:hypothetical protein